MAKLNSGDVVIVTARFGQQTKTRPAIVVETRGDRAYMLLGSTRNLVACKSSIIVMDAKDMKTMGLRYITRFGFGYEADQWLSSGNVVKRIGRVPEGVALQLGHAWANSKFVRAEVE